MYQSDNNKVITEYIELIRLFEMILECIKRLTKILYMEIHKISGDDALFESIVKNLREKECGFKKE